MNQSTILRAGTFLLLMLCTITARADDRSATASAGKAAAHAALSDGADVPSDPPRLPAQAAEHAWKATAEAAIAKREKTNATGRAHSQAEQRAADDARSTHMEAADRAAQGSAGSAARSANADGRAAAGQARAAAARAKAHPPHPVTPTHP